MFESIISSSQPRCTGEAFQKWKLKYTYFYKNSKEHASLFNFFKKLFKKNGLVFCSDLRNHGEEIHMKMSDE